MKPLDSHIIMISMLVVFLLCAKESLAKKDVTEEPALKVFV